MGYIEGRSFAFTRPKLSEIHFDRSLKKIERPLLCIQCIVIFVKFFLFK